VHELEWLDLAYKAEMKTIREVRDAHTYLIRINLKQQQQSKPDKSSLLGMAGEALGGRNQSIALNLPDLSSIEPVLYFIHTNEQALNRCITLSSKDDLYNPPLFLIL